jgi:3-dehydroquinate synthase
MGASGEEECERVGVSLGARSYDIWVGEGLLARAGGLLRPVLARPRVAIVTDDTVARLYLPPLRAALDRAGIEAVSIVVPAGEETKSFAQLERLCTALLDARIERSTTLIALGGGVIGDLTGFAAGIVLRGVPFVQIPTTLLAQVDSSVGGKTGINTAHGKNLVGLFYQPRLVLADVATLDSLPDRQRRAGYAEVVKYGLINDPAFFSWLEAHGSAVLAGDRAAQRHAVVTSCRAKAAIVAADERETGPRALLNLGHTFGHALEAETGFSDALLHGEAVALGLVLAADLSVALGCCPPADAARVRNHLAAVGLATELTALRPEGWSVPALLAHMRHDKKVRDGTVTFIVLDGIGRARVSDGVPLPAVEALLRACTGISR